MPLVSFDTPWKHQKTFRFLIHFWSVARNGLIILAKKLYHRCLTRFLRVRSIHSLWLLSAYWCLFCNHWTNLLCPCRRLWVFFVCRVNGFVCFFILECSLTPSSYLQTKSLRKVSGSVSSPSCEFKWFPPTMYMFRVSNRNARKRCEICLKSIIKVPEWCYWYLFLFHTFFYSLNYWIWIIIC